MATNYKIEGSNFENYFIPKSTFLDTGLWVWGLNSVGQLGDNTIVNKSSPIQTIAGGTNWLNISSEVAPSGTTGGYRTVANKTDGTLWSWGNNLLGALGDNTVTHRSSPVQTVSGGTNWREVSSGYSFTGAIKTDGTLWLWGTNGNGQLGANDRVSRSSPVQTISGGTNWKYISAGAGHALAIKTDGTLWSWGFNSSGQLADGSVLDKSSPIQTVSGGTNWKQVSSGDSYFSAIKTDGTLWSAGYNGFGQLGDNTVTWKSSPVQTIAGGTNWQSVSCGDNTTSAIKTDGTLWMWGYNNSGGLGTNDVTNRSSPAQTVAGGTNWKQASCGASHTIAVKQDGTLWTWGSNNFGQLGTNDIVHRSSPIQTVAGGTNWKKVAAGAYSSIGIKYIS